MQVSHLRQAGWHAQQHLLSAFPFFPSTLTLLTDAMRDCQQRAKQGSPLRAASPSCARCWDIIWLRGGWQLRGGGETFHACKEGFLKKGFFEMIQIIANRVNRGVYSAQKE